MECGIGEMGRRPGVPDLHVRRYGKKAEDVKFYGQCPNCGTRIDEYGWCGCGTMGGD